MARIRSIYPTTPTDPEFALNPVEGRLLFIYSWTVADDAGNFERNSLGLKMALFPGDEWATVARITELVAALIVGRFYEPYEVDGKQYLHVRNFAKYQKPDHPTAPRFPLQPGQEYTYDVRQGHGWSTKTVRGALPEPPPNVPRKNSERSRRIGSGLGTGSGTVKEGIGGGKDRRGPGRKGKHDARPLALVGQAASSSTKGNGNGSSIPEASWKGNGVKEAAVAEVVRLISTGEIDLAGASDKLRTSFNFSSREINEPALLLLLQQLAN